MTVRIEPDEEAAEDGRHGFLLNGHAEVLPSPVDPIDGSVILDHEG